MNIQTVAENLRNTIAGKEHLLDQYSRVLDGDKMLYEQKIAAGAASEFVKINIDELKRILQDVEQCEPFNNYEKASKHFKVYWRLIF